ncbi:DUF1624 domain-containing protein [Nitratireductor kimnyeongensis]|uniref:DUF1624 domain-containing protein n=1 Tax=Nitratireductor kimnyeongensis TaxID=430679 RepID=A0ABW0T4E5_9HYPH|nr:heparan-alpha-glucosaminide N-acetyltransferase [Nitratireductor kimnyeongensis]QZZ35273.1 DUF1624 domain-containing protein [Nitratireductor kimnyeongensis]
MRHQAAGKPRIEIIDVARGGALVAMAVYHFGWDLEFFGYMDAGTTVTGGWRLFARAIATSFLFLVGVSLFLAHEKRIRWAGFLKRLAMITVAAGVISAATWFALPQGFIFFGILHHIAVASLLGLAFLRFPAWLLLVVAAGLVVAPHVFSAPLFDAPALWWVGLSTFRPPSNDYVPLLPWFGAVIAGIGSARIARDTGFLHSIALLKPSHWQAPFALAGRHSLAFYLLHQPVLIACVWVLAQLWPPTAVPADIRFTQACMSQCAETRGAEFCATYCTCFTDTLEAEDRLDLVMSGQPGEEMQSRLSQIATECTMRAETGSDLTQRNPTNERP